MRIILCALFSICLSQAASAQWTPEFLLPFYFEDALGNRDTIFIGFDERASHIDINPEFGEVHIVAPFDSVFEVRAIHSQPPWMNEKLSKIIVENSSETAPDCNLFGYPEIYIHALHYPVTISWSDSIFQTSNLCSENNYLSPSYESQLIEFWYTSYEPIYCLDPGDEIILEEDFKVNEEIFFEFEVQGEGVQSIPGLALTSILDYPHCLTTLGMDESSRGHELLLRPSIATDYIEISFNSAVDASIDRCDIIDLNGKVRSSIKAVGSGTRIAIESLESGIYFLQVHGSDASRSVEKFIKR